MAASKLIIDQWIKEGIEMGATHIISVCDGFDHEDYPVYVMPGDNLQEKKAKYDGESMQRINEVIELKPAVKPKELDPEHYALLHNGIEFTHTALGQAVFRPRGDNHFVFGLLPDNWTIAQLRAMANYMEANRNCTLFGDGSGEPCK